MALTRTTLTGFLVTMGMLIWCGSASAAGIRVVPSTPRVLPGEAFYVDIVAEGIPAEGLGGVQFRLNVSVPEGTVSGAADLAQGGATEVAVASPLLVSQATATRSGIGDFFWNGRGDNGILVLDNEALTNGTALYTFAHTNGATPPSGSGSVARFMIRVGSGVNAKEITIGLTDVMLLDGGPFYPLDSNNGATVQIGCFTRMPDVLGLSLPEAASRLTQSQLVLGATYEIDNTGGIRPLNAVLEQSSPAGSELLCEAPVNLAVNVPPLDVTQGAASDKPGDDTGVVLISWRQSLSGDVAGYRVYLGTSLIKTIGNPAATGTEVGGLPNGVASQLEVTAYDTFGNESQGVVIAATPLDDVAPVIVIGGVTDGAYYRSDVTPQVSVSDTNPGVTTITLNGDPFASAPITADGAYVLAVTAADSSGNSTTKDVRFVIDTTAPAITVTGVTTGTFYRTTVGPVLTISDAHLKWSSTTLNGEPYVSQTPISAAGNYELLVSAEDLAGNSASLAIAFVIDSAAPTLSVSTLSDGTYTNNETLNVAGTARDDSALRDLQINGIPVQVAADGSFSYPLVLHSGPNPVITVATDLAGNQTSDTRTINLDKTAPALVVTNPADNAKTGTALLTVSGNIDETSTVVVKLGANVQSAAQTGNTFTSGITLIPGYNTIEITATDLAGNKSTLKRTVILDDQKPSLAVTDPSQDIRTNQASLTIKGTASDALTAVSVGVAMDGLNFTPPVVNGAYEQALTFTAEKSYAIVVTATDEVGSSTGVQRNVIYDVTPPVFSIDPVSTPTNQNSQTISGTREEGATIAISCASAAVGEVTYPSATGWSVVVSGFTTTEANDLSVSATDVAGNVTSATALILYDTTPPTGTIVINSGAAVTGSPEVQLLLDAADTNGVSRMRFSTDGSAWTDDEAYAATRVLNLAPGDGAKQVRVKYMDTAGNWSEAASTSIVLDATPPITSASPTGGIYKTGLNVTLTANEQAVIYYATDGTLPGTNSPIYSQAISIPASAILKYFAKDPAGNSSEVITQNYVTDTIPPAITVTGVADGGAYNTAITPVIAVTDANLKGSSMTLNGQPYAPGTSVTVEGDYSLAVAAEDLAGNTAGLTLRFIVDQTPPVSSAAPASPKYVSGGVLFVSDRTPVTVSAQDSGIAPSGVAGMEYRIDGSQAWNAYAAPLAFAGLADGSHSLNYRAFDRATNWENAQLLTATIDNTPPASLVAVGSPKFTAADGAIYATGETLFAVSATDNLSGVATTLLRLESGPWSVYTPLILPGEGMRTFHYKSLDNLANEEVAKSFTVIIDNTPPVTAFATGISQYEAVGKLFVTSATKLTLAATDNLSGVARSEFRIDGGAWTAYAPFTVAVEGEHVIGFRSIDNVGNGETEKSISVTVDNTSPLTVIITGTPNHETGGRLFVTAGTQFSLTASDNLSGVARSEYRVDGGAWSAYMPFTITAEGEHVIGFRSIDNVGNWETEKTLQMIVDKSPPQTAVTMGTPKYEAGGKLVVTPATQFALAATDSHSGVAKTEYHIDGGAWRVYAPFAIVAEGEHVIGFRSSDNLGNQEMEKVLTVIVDNSPPGSLVSVGSPSYIANGNIYVSGRTDFSISATDGSSGVKGSLYAIDNAVFAAYGAPFNLAPLPDGDHVIAYWSSDNVNNNETAKLLDVILDKTPPTTVITASDPLTADVVNTVSPNTTFTLTATDNLAGVKGIWYRIDGGQWQLFAEEFTLPGLQAGAHSISFTASDNVGNDETERTIKVRLVQAEVKKEISLDPLVLVGAWTDNLNKVKNQGAIDVLKSILSSLHVDFHVAENGDDFKELLRSGRYTTYFLIDYKDEKVGRELREGVNYGDGMIFIKTRPSPDAALDEVFGVKFSGKTTNDNLPVNLPESPLSAAGIIPSSGKSVVATVEAAHAQVYGNVSDKKGQNPSIVFNKYGNGKALLFTYDLLGSVDKQKVADLVAASINLLKPERNQVRALASLPVRLIVANSTESLGLQVVETIPAGTTVDSVTPQGVDTGAAITWEQYVGASERAGFGYFLNLPDMQGEYTAISYVSFANYGGYRPYKSMPLTVTVRAGSTDLLHEVIDELNAIPVALSSDLLIVTEAVNTLSGLSVNPVDAKEAENSVANLIRVINSIRNLSVDTADIRLKLDELLKILEKKWHLLDVLDKSG